MFMGRAAFENATFEGVARFGQASFHGATSFERARFLGPASFEAILSDRAFSLASADFRQVPDFIQAHFAESPRLDNSHFRPGLVEPGGFWGWPARATTGLFKRLFHGDRDIPARWRALKRLAIEGHDHEREQHFFAMEQRSARFAGDWPLPLSPLGLKTIAKGEAEALLQRCRRWAWNTLAALPLAFWRSAAWAGFFRFWLGLLYQVTSDFGRSVLRPLILWALTTAVATLYFLGESPDVAAERTKRLAAKPAAGVLETLKVRADTSLAGWLANAPCFDREEGRDQEGKPQVTGLVAPVRQRTSAANEALHLAFRNGFIVLDGGGDAAHRVYGCLYGIERFADNPVPIVPSTVSYASVIQKLVSALAIFLLGLGIRNMLKMR
jgi:hypothetical protein